MPYHPNSHAEITDAGAGAAELGLVIMRHAQKLRACHALGGVALVDATLRRLGISSTLIREKVVVSIVDEAKFVRSNTRPSPLKVKALLAWLRRHAYPRVDVRTIDDVHSGEALLALLSSIDPLKFPYNPSSSALENFTHAFEQLRQHFDVPSMSLSDPTAITSEAYLVSYLTAAMQRLPDAAPVRARRVMQPSRRYITVSSLTTSPKNSAVTTSSLASLSRVLLQRSTGMETRTQRTGTSWGMSDSDKSTAADGAALTDEQQDSVCGLVPLSSTEIFPGFKAEMLQFVQFFAEDYAGLQVQDLSSSLHDGRAFLALMHTLSPSECEFTPTDDATQNRTLAFACAKETFNITTALEATNDECCAHESEVFQFLSRLVVHAPDAALIAAVPHPSAPDADDDDLALKYQKWRCAKVHAEHARNQAPPPPKDFVDPVHLHALFIESIRSLPPPLSS
jgi:hypothetical protein